MYISVVLLQQNLYIIKENYHNDTITPCSKRIRLSNYPKIEELLDDWFRDIMSRKNVTLDGPMIQTQALKYAKQLNETDFKASFGWLDNFKKRHNIVFKKIVGERGLVDEDIIQPGPKDEPEQEIVTHNDTLNTINLIRRRLMKIKKDTNSLLRDLDRIESFEDSATECATVVPPL